eukprot:Selendium_serpulae@DN6304_c1_g1_i3.p1
MSWLLGNNKRNVSDCCNGDAYQKLANDYARAKELRASNEIFGKEPANVASKSKSHTMTTQPKQPSSYSYYKNFQNFQNSKSNTSTSAMQSHIFTPSFSLDDAQKCTK